jgi:predicted deacetylase
MVAELVVSLSGVGPSTLARCADLAAELDRRRVPLSLLLAPRQAVADEVSGWVRRRVAAGDALVLHGFDHQPNPARRAVALRRRAGFAALPAHEAGLRLVAARAAVARSGLATDLFAPPGWLASPGTVVALRRHRFAVCADMAGVRDLRTGDVRPGRVRMVGEHWRHLLGVGRAVRRGGLVRLGVDAVELDRLATREAVLEAVDLALHHGATATTYSSTASPRGSTTTSTPSGAVPTRTR